MGIGWWFHKIGHFICLLLISLLLVYLMLPHCCYNRYIELMMQKLVLVVSSNLYRVADLNFGLWFGYLCTWKLSIPYPHTICWFTYLQAARHSLYKIEIKQQIALFLDDQWRWGWRLGCRKNKCWRCGIAMHYIEVDLASLVEEVDALLVFWSNCWLYSSTPYEL